jgi:hypothetical protein
MLRITRMDTPEATTLRLEGRLCGPWVDELHQCWAGLLEQKVPLEADLDGLSFLDASGALLLRQMERQGTPLLRSCAFIRCLLHPEPFPGDSNDSEINKETYHVSTVRARNR